LAGTPSRANREAQRFLRQDCVKSVKICDFTLSHRRACSHSLTSLPPHTPHTPHREATAQLHAGIRRHLHDLDELQAHHNAVSSCTDDGWGDALAALVSVGEGTNT
jgi:hypothetical protein